MYVCICEYMSTASDYLKLHELAVGDICTYMHTYVHMYNIHGCMYLHTSHAFMYSTCVSNQ